jgi:hypothetical protein
VPALKIEEERIENILGDRPARFNVEDSEDANPGPVPWQLGELGTRAVPLPASEPRPDAGRGKVARFAISSARTGFLLVDSGHRDRWLILVAPMLAIAWGIHQWRGRRSAVPTAQR